MDTFKHKFNNKFEIEKSKINFDHLWKIKQIDVDIVTLSKYEIRPEVSLLNPETHSLVAIKELIGTEIHKVTPYIQVELSGKVGEILKSFEVKRVNASVKISKIVWL